LVQVIGLEPSPWLPGSSAPPVDPEEIASRPRLVSLPSTTACSKQFVLKHSRKPEADGPSSACAYVENGSCGLAVAANLALVAFVRFDQFHRPPLVAVGDLTSETRPKFRASSLARAEHATKAVAARLSGNCTWEQIMPHDASQLPSSCTNSASARPCAVASGSGHWATSLRRAARHRA
jgi:hypothetical protein